MGSSLDWENGNLTYLEIGIPAFQLFSLLFRALFLNLSAEDVLIGIAAAPVRDWYAFWVFPR